MKRWAIDPHHSSVSFAVKHISVSNIRGHFKNVSGTILFDPADPAGFAVDASVDADSVWTGYDKRDEHLRSQDFFHAEEHPKISFRSSGARQTGPNHYAVTGDLTVRGITLPITFDVETAGPVRSPYGGETTLGIHAAVSVNRHDFGVTWNEPMEDGNPIVAPDVLVTVDAQADLVEE